MIKNFGFRNFKSFYEQQYVDFTRTILNQNDDSCISPASDIPTELLKTVAIYGANAAGKTSFVQALQYMQRAIQDASFSTAKRLFSGLRQHKAADAGVTSEFDIEFFVGDTLYNYGFEMSTVRFVSEWLYQYPKGKGSGRTLIERFWSQDEEKYFYKSPALKLEAKVKQFIEEALNEKELFLTRAASLNVKQVEDVYNWFEEKLLVFEHDDLKAREYFRRVMLNEYSKEYSTESNLHNFLISLDIGFSDFKLLEKKINADNFGKKELDSLIESILEKEKDSDPSLTYDDVLQGLKMIHPEFYVKARGKDIKLQFEELSGGSRKMFDLSGVFHDVIVNERVIVVDELTESLHPLLSKKLIETFNSYKESRAQMIFTTHDIPLMDMCFERDQIWITESDERNDTSSIYPLSQFKLRRGTSFEAAYLAGMLGGIPRYMD